MVENIIQIIMLALIGFALCGIGWELRNIANILKEKLK